MEPVGRLRVLVVDDEALGRDCVRLALAGEPEFEVVGECEGADQAIAAIADLAPDIVVLDIQMPGRSGFDVIREVGPERMPATVFVTAHEEFALQAFEVHALDYVLKPFEDARLMGALRYAAANVGRAGPDPRLAELTQAMATGVVARDAAPYARRLLVRADERYRFVPVQEIEYIEADGNNLRVHTRAEEHSVRMTMQDMQRRLDPALFVRIHRSTIVRIGAVREIQPWFGGDYVAILVGGQQLRLSRTYRDRVLRPFL